MAIPRKAKIDQWYEDEEGRNFRVVAIEEDAIEVQYFDGDIEEIDAESWYQMGLKAVTEPKDWTGPFDDLVADDLGDTYGTNSPEDWNGPADEMDFED